MGLFSKKKDNKKDDKEKFPDDPLRRFIYRMAKWGVSDLEETGVEASAEVLAIEGTGWEVLNQPLAKMKLKVEASYGAGFETIAYAMVDRIAAPRTGDRIKIKYNSEDTTQVLIIKEEIK